MKKKSILKSQEGFTLVEIIAVLIILGILAAVAVPRYLDLETSSKNRALDAAVAELNGRESLAWADVKISSTGGWDAAAVTQVWTLMGAVDLGTDYTWTGLTEGGGTLNFRGATRPLTRTPPTNITPGLWN